MLICSQLIYDTLILTLIIYYYLGCTLLHISDILLILMKFYTSCKYQYTSTTYSLLLLLLLICSINLY